jgi:hypothetical protein
MTLDPKEHNAHLPGYQEKHISSGQADRFSRRVIPFGIQFGYTSIGWSDDRVNIVVSHQITF